ncbi:conjugal transfer protein [Peptostreptococcaceae bacterium oral taxon 081]|nr:conjugal transfer protein [Peptostreptococcaceae bacterium oral taxon 081]
MKKTNKINKKTGILIGVGSALSIGMMMVVLLKNKTKKGSVLEKDDFDFDFDEIEEDSCVNNKFDAEKDKDDIGKEEIDSLVDEYLEYESKTEEEKQEEFRDLSVKVMDLLLKEVISMSETLDLVKRDMDRIGEVKALVEELENCKEEIISLWEHMEKLSDLREEITGKKNRG